MINSYVSLMCEIKKNGKETKFVETGPSSYKKGFTGLLSHKD
jgi:hypothetical protein